MSDKKKVVVLGAYGLIGSECVRALKTAGFFVKGIGRSRTHCLRSDREIEWIIADATSLSINEWKEILSDAHFVVNAAGALQEGLRDNLEAIHVSLISNLIKAIEGTPIRIIQVSAAGVSEDASTKFFQTKAKGDKLLMTSPGLDWVILRPTLVVSSQAYGGTALIRSSAAIPVLGIKVFPDAMIQTVNVKDVARAVISAVSLKIPSKTLVTLTETEQRTLFETTTKFRSWLGFSPWRYSFNLPKVLVFFVAYLADFLGWFGWRSPFRSSAMKVLEQGITGDHREWDKLGEGPCDSLSETLDSIPSSIQERWFSYLYLLMPIAIFSLSLFWAVSGVIALLHVDQAMFVLSSVGVSTGFSQLIVVGGALVDLLLGFSVLIRQWAKSACLGMIAVSLAYMMGATILTPELWQDPLGPLVKIIPSTMLAVCVLPLLDER